MQQHRKRLIGCGLAIVATLFARPAFAESGVTDRTIKLGMTIPTTGDVASRGIEYLAGARAVFDQVNRAGGVFGRKIELDVRDDHYSADKAAENARELVDKDGVWLMFGGVGAAPTKHVRDAMLPSGTPVFAPYTGAPSLRGDHLVYLTHSTYDEEARVIAHNIAVTGLSDVCAVIQDDDYGTEGLAALNKVAAANQLHLVDVAEVKKREKNAAPSEKLFGGQCQAYYIASMYVLTADFVKRAHSHGIIGPFYTLAAVSADALADQLKNQAAGVMVTEVIPSPYSGKTPVQLNFQREPPSVPRTYAGFEGWLAARVLVSALQKLGHAPTRSALLDLLHQRDLQLDVDHLSFGAYGLHQVALTVMSGKGTVSE
jgi:ABC-type branched-subunit amino acid transport system substrate-binding protein